MNPRLPLGIEPALPASREGRLALHRYVEDIVGRFHGRPATTAEVDAALFDEPSADLVPPTGLLLLARRAEAVLGCAGVRWVDDGFGELTRVHVSPAARGEGIGSALVLAIEASARDRGVHRLRLDTRSDLVEARRLYDRLGYEPVEPFNDGPYADHWLAKTLPPAPDHASTVTSGG